MGLTGWVLLVVLGLIAVVLFALLVAGVPRSGSGVVRGASRAAQVLVLNVVVVLICGAALNDQYLFYSSWSDLLGSRSDQVRAHHGGSVHDVVSARVEGSLSHVVTPADLPALPQPGARLQTYTVLGQRSDASGQVLVDLPPGYDPRSSRTYPVIVGLHGFPGGPKSFAHLTFLRTIDQLTAEHRLAPSIVVMPRIDTPPSLDTECVNGPPGEPQTDTWLSRDIPTWTLQHFRARNDRTSWATMGYSYGAWCAASLTMRHPGVFGGAIVLLGYFRPDFSSAYHPLLPRSKGPGYDLVAIAKEAPPPVAMWVLTSREDSLSYPTTAKFLSVARRPLSVSATVLAHGGHRVAVFEAYIESSLSWLGQTLPGFRP